MPQPPVADAWASDLLWLTAANGYGPAERDRSNGESGAADGHVLTLAGKTYEKGIGAHADSDIEVYLGGRCTALAGSPPLEGGNLLATNGHVHDEVLRLLPD